MEELWQELDLQNKSQKALQQSWMKKINKKIQETKWDIEPIRLVRKMDTKKRFLYVELKCNVCGSTWKKITNGFIYSTAIFGCDECRKEDKNKKNAKSKLYAGYLVFEFKLDGKIVYKIQTDYMKQDGSDIENRMKSEAGEVVDKSNTKNIIIGFL